VALNIRGDFERYLEAVMNILQRAQGVEVDNPDDEDAVEAVEDIQSAVLDAYTGIVAVKGFAQSIYNTNFYFTPSL
jgi:hypothetical protein